MGKNRKNKHRHQHVHVPQKRREPQTEKEILEAIGQLEMRRMNLGHYPSIRRVAYDDAITQSITKLREKLAILRAEKKNAQ
jgi:hypothetical protein